MKHGCSIAVGLLLLLLCLCVQVESRKGRSLQSSRLIKPYNVCTSDWAPMVMCEDISDPANYTGYQVALFREISKDLGWQENIDWTFTCVDWNSMIDDLASPNGSCSFAAAGVEVITPNVLLGLKFSWPIYKSGYRILIAAAKAGGVWSFTQAFHWSVWLTLGATSLGIPVLISVFELLSYGNRANRKGLRGWTWYCTAKMVQVATYVGDPRTWASKVLVIGYACLTLIMVHLFTACDVLMLLTVRFPRVLLICAADGHDMTATTASKMTVDHLSNDIKSVHDLAGKKVQTWEGYTSSLRKISTEADALPWDTNADTQAFIDNLLSHKYQALVLDSATILDMAAHADNCDLFTVGEPFQTFELAIAFPPEMDDDLIGNISASITRMQTNRRVLDDLENVFMKGLTEGPMADLYAATLDAFYDHSCPEAFAVDASGAHHADTQIKFQQVAGLWLIVLIALGLAMVITASKRLQFYYWRKARRATRQAATLSRLAAQQAGADVVDDQARPEKKLHLDSADGIPERMLSLTAKPHPSKAGKGSSWMGSSYPTGSSSHWVSGSAGGGSHVDCVAEISLPPGGIVSEEGGVQDRASAVQPARAAGASNASQQQQVLRITAELAQRNVNTDSAAAQAVDM